MSDMSPISELLAPSVQGELMSIQYYVRFFVKYDSWLDQSGEGHCVTIPIKIDQSYVSVPGPLEKYDFN